MARRGFTIEFWPVIEAVDDLRMLYDGGRGLSEKLKERTEALFSDEGPSPARVAIGGGRMSTDASEELMAVLAEVRAIRTAE